MIGGSHGYRQQASAVGASFRLRAHAGASAPTRERGALARVPDRVLTSRAGDRLRDHLRGTSAAALPSSFNMLVSTAERRSGFSGALPPRAAIIRLIWPLKRRSECSSRARVHD